MRGLAPYLQSFPVNDTERVMVRTVVAEIVDRRAEAGWIAAWAALVTSLWFVA